MTQVPLQEDQFLILRGPNSFDPQALIRAVEPLGFSAFVGSRSQMAQSEIERMLVDKGISYLWQLVQLQEAVLPPAPAGERAPLLRVLGVMIQRLAPTRGFTIVDRYLLPGSGPDPEYLAELMSLLEPVASRVDQLRLVTGERNPTLWRELTSALAASCPSCLVTHAQSSRYHDRFWIADDARGLLVGTSPMVLVADTPSSTTLRMRTSTPLSRTSATKVCSRELSLEASDHLASARGALCDVIRSEVDGYCCIRQQAAQGSRPGIRQMKQMTPLMTLGSCFST